MRHDGIVINHQKEGEDHEQEAQLGPAERRREDPVLELHHEVF